MRSIHREVNEGPCGSPDNDRGRRRSKKVRFRPQETSNGAFGCERGINRLIDHSGVFGRAPQSIRFRKAT